MIGFALGTGRCGTKFLSEVMSRIPNVDSHHELNPLNETFMRFAHWYDLPVDPAGFLLQKSEEMAPSLRAGQVFFESSAYLSLSVPLLAAHFDCRFVLLVRHPAKVINSYLHKGWYRDAAIRDRADLAPSYQPTDQFHHFLGRILPRTFSVNDWNALSRVGRLAWYWSALNQAVLDAFQDLPENRYRVVRLEDLSDQTVMDPLIRFLGGEQPLAPDQLASLNDARPNRFTTVPRQMDWTSQEMGDYQRFIYPLVDQFGYVPELKVMR